MNRFTSFAIGVALAGALAGQALAETQVEIAAKLNDEGKELMYADKYAEAAKKFQEAVARVPEAKYFVNLCAARLQTGELDLALTACNAVDRNTPTADQKSRADKLIAKINEEAKKQNLELHAGGGGGGDPGGPTPPRDPAHPDQPDPSKQPLYAPAVGRPLETNLVREGRPEHRYTWTLGLDLFAGGGRIGQPDYYATTMTGFRIRADYMLSPRRRVGAQIYLQDSFFERDRLDPNMGGLTVGDFGVAIYKHLCLGTPRLCITPLGGLHVSALGPDSDSTFNYFAAGARGEVALALAFGSRFEHVLSAMVGANLYSSASTGDASDVSVADAGLDVGGVTGYVALGYTYRFNTPIGRRALVILE